MQTRLAHDPVREKAQLQQQHEYIDAPIIRTYCASYRVCTRRKYVVTAIDVL